MIVDQYGTAFVSDAKSRPYLLRFAPEDNVGGWIEMYLADNDGCGSPAFAIRASTARQVAAELLNRADRIDDIADAESTQ